MYSVGAVCSAQSVRRNEQTAVRQHAIRVSDAVCGRVHSRAATKQRNGTGTILLLHALHVPAHVLTARHTHGANLYSRSLVSIVHSELP